MLVEHSHYNKKAISSGHSRPELIKPHLILSMVMLFLQVLRYILFIPQVCENTFHHFESFKQNFVSVRSVVLPSIHSICIFLQSKCEHCCSCTHCSESPRSFYREDRAFNPNFNKMLRKVSQLLLLAVNCHIIYVKCKRDTEDFYIRVCWMQKSVLQLLNNSLCSLTF